MIRIVTASRLHFGLLSLPNSSQQHWPNRLDEKVLPARHFGGVGLMVELPGLRLSATPAAEWSAQGSLSNRVLAYTRHFVAHCPDAPLRPQHFDVESAPPEHAGLGTGTQLGLAVARLLMSASESADTDVLELARCVGRGSRSALGIHGFAQGGFLVEGGKRSAAAIAPLAARALFPESWRIVLVVPPWGVGLHAGVEVQAFQSLPGTATALAQTDALCRLVLLGMLPALAERDLHTFGESLYDFNQRVGAWFRSVQGGIYMNSQVADLVLFIRQEGIQGVGQSSWGPSVFAVVNDESRAGALAQRIRKRFGLGPGEVLITRGCNHGARIYAD